MKKVVAVVENFGNVLFDNVTEVDITNDEFKDFCERTLRSKVVEVRDVTEANVPEILKNENVAISVMVSTHKKALLIKQSEL